MKPAGDSDQTGHALAETTFTIHITPRNDAPVLSPFAPTLAPISGHSSNPAGQTVASIVGRSISDSDPGAMEGIALVGTTGNGHWQLSLNNGKTWKEVSPVSSSSGLLLRATDRLRFLPAAGWTGTASIDYLAWGPNDLGLDLKRNPGYHLKTTDECTKYVWDRVKNQGIKMGMAILTEPGGMARSYDDRSAGSI